MFNNIKYLIIPDLHGKYKSLIKILKKYIEIKDGIIQPNDYIIVLLGDYIDKGSKLEQIKLVNFLFNNIDELTILIGNHEMKVERKIKLGHKFCLNNSYDFYRYIENNEGLRKKFLTIYDSQIKVYSDENIICTHSPCLYSNLEKQNDGVVQYKVPYKNKNREFDDLKVFFKNIFEENNYKKLHICGHLGIDKPIINNRQIWLDTFDESDITYINIENNFLSFLNDSGLVNDVYHFDKDREKVLELLFNSF